MSDLDGIINRLEKKNQTYSVLLSVMVTVYHRGGSSFFGDSRRQTEFEFIVDRGVCEEDIAKAVDCLLNNDPDDCSRFEFHRKYNDRMENNINMVLYRNGYKEQKYTGREFKTRDELMLEFAKMLQAIMQGKRYYEEKKKKKKKKSDSTEYQYDRERAELRSGDKNEKTA